MSTMNFLEKDLETIIWENYAACEQRGLFLNYKNGFEHGLRFRQMGLHPFGVADLVNIYYNPFNNRCFVQIIECKRQQVNAATYLQAKRYGTAIEDIFFDFYLDGIKPEITYYLIGSELNTDGDLAHAIAKDESCKTYLYKYGVDGIRFEDHSRYWGYGISSIGTEKHIAPRADIKNHIIKGQIWRSEQELVRGNFESPLLVTSEGVLLNTWLTDFDSYGPAD